MTVSSNTKPVSVAPIVPVLFTATIFLSASLLFFVQPLFTKIVLPSIGGAPAVWTTAMLFFQTVLIAGYLYAHLSTRFLPVMAQVGLHLALWAAALFFLPLSIQDGWQMNPDAPVALQTLLLFAFGVGMPFAVLSANAPLIQSWYSKSGGPSADDPYFLYGASNLGSLCALLAFPLLAEPLFGARQIGWGWAAGFVLLGAFLALSGLAARHGARTIPQRSVAKTGPKPRTYAFWLLLAFIPSSLMLSVTTKISTDIGSFPLVWVLPLSLYLLTFVLTFTKRPLISERWLNIGFIGSLAVLVFFLTGVKLAAVNVGITMILLAAFFVVAMKAHQTLYAARPSEHHLTIFYVTMSVGGALGGLFNSIVAPGLFNEIHEMRVTVLLAATLLLIGAARPGRKDLQTGLFGAVAVLAPVTLFNLMPETVTFDTAMIAMTILMLGALILFRQNPVSGFIIVATVLGLSTVMRYTPALFKDRSFFGTHLVRDLDGTRLYRNGTTIHGAQRTDEVDGDGRPTPLFYYHADGPMAQIVNSPTGQAARDIGIVGLGVGSLACYSRPGQNWEFYEIDAMVDRVARDPALFTFMSSCAPDAPTHIGDARIVLDQQQDALFDILVIDAYSSDAVPVHLTTIEALALYRDRVRPDGLIVFHISNRYYDISLPLGRSAAELGLSGLLQRYQGGDDDDPTNSPSHVVLMANTDAALAPFAQDDRWSPLHSDGGRIWTDDYANVLSILN